MTRLKVSTQAKVELREVTAQVEEAVRASGVKSGVCYVFVPHTTAGILINENADPDVGRDILAQLEKLVPERGGYFHREGNAPAHVKSCLVGPSQVLPVEEGRLVLGTWQGIFLAEFDGPRQRTIMVKVLSDKTL